MKEVICVSDQYKGFFDVAGNTLGPPSKKPQKDEIYTVDIIHEWRGVTYYHIPGLDERDDDCYWDANLFADISEMDAQIRRSLSAPKPIKVYVDGGFIKEIIPRPTEK